MGSFKLSQRLLDRKTIFRGELAPLPEFLGPDSGQPDHGHLPGPK
jgi:hypothetical protein